MQNHARHHLKNRRFFVTKKGLLALGHLETLPGDEVWIFNHGRVPFTLRRTEKLGTPANENGEDYLFGGHCYVQGSCKDSIRTGSESLRTLNNAESACVD
ncbi:het domain containing protein [Apiospora saccharicola]|uniref:Het domain containing protein n=1 Tax=Apiospora saccharicola TaxID=335842 RepID=A0ABR1WKN6_9PEZI